MDINILRQIIVAYKNDFAHISNEEIYKWRAVHTYKTHWDISSPNFHEMVENALGDTGNLLSSTNYFPRRMIENYARVEPEMLRNAFVHLYDEDSDFVLRMKEFQHEINVIHDRHYGTDYLQYQDHRAIMVYLALEYPERYFFYKYEMFKDFVEQVAYPYKPKPGATENITHFQNICEIVLAEIERDDEIISMHLNRLGQIEYSDNHLHILTQDVIYAAVEHLSIEPTPVVSIKLSVTDENYSAMTIIPSLQGAFINHIQNAERNKRIGNLGELFILEWEERRLRNVGVSNPRIVHDAANLGDGLGYDISAYSEDVLVRYIEVKTTTGPITQPFFITASELKRSQDDARRFYLYRVFNFNPETKTGEVYIIQGDLSRYCVSPSQFEVRLIKD